MELLDAHVLHPLVHCHLLCLLALLLFDPLDLCTKVWENVTEQTHFVCFYSLVLFFSSSLVVVVLLAFFCLLAVTFFL